MRGAKFLSRGFCIASSSVTLSWVLPIIMCVQLVNTNESVGFVSPNPRQCLNLD